MRIGVTCFECCKDTDYSEAEITFSPLQDSSLYTFRCSRGHESHIVLYQMRFEVLAEVAVQALLDGYYREAVSSFAASLERFFEFFISTIYVAKNSTTDKEFDEAWKVVRRQSERQLGMFVGFYLQEIGKVPPMLAEGQVAFRNKIVHQGYIPSESEALSFGQDVIDVVHEVLRIMSGRYRKAMQVMTFNHSKEASSRRVDDGVVVGYMSHPMVYKLYPEDGEEPKNLSDELVRRRISREWRQPTWAAMPER